MAGPNSPISRENIERPAISSAVDCMIASRSRSSPVRPARAVAVSAATAAMWRASIGSTRGAMAGAMVRRWCFQSSPSLSSSPLPVIGRRMRIDAGLRW